MNNYFNYFTEIEERFQKRRGSLLLLSTLDWALIETWREADVPLAAVLRGIDAAFDRYEARKASSRARRINGLAWCSQEVMTAVEEMKEAAIGASSIKAERSPAPGFEQDRIATHLENCAHKLQLAALTGIAQTTAAELVARLIALSLEVHTATPDIEALERNLLVLEEKLLAALTASTPEGDLVGLREQATRELAPYRSRMQAVQLRQVEQQFLHKRLLELWKLPRLSLFYMSLA